MTAETSKEQFTFQAEISRLLHLLWRELRRAAFRLCPRCCVIISLLAAGSLSRPRRVERVTHRCRAALVVQWPVLLLALLGAIPRPLAAATHEHGSIVALTVLALACTAPQARLG